jgi:hypothetical protein
MEQSALAVHVIHRLAVEVDIIICLPRRGIIKNSLESNVCAQLLAET